MSSLLSLLTRILSRKKLIIKNIDKTSLLGIKYLRLFDVLTICFFSTSERKRDY